jgi:hypothetical protein
VCNNSRLLLLGLLLVGCGGDEPTDATVPDPSTQLEEPAATAATPPAATAPVATVAPEAFDTAAARGERPLLREVYGWRGGGRDPFRPLVVAQAGGPELVDLVLTSVLYQASDPSRSVAIFRDTGNNKRYTVGMGDRIGRLSVVGITNGTATLRMNDFGTTRDQTYSLRRSEDGNP